MGFSEALHGQLAAAGAVFEREVNCPAALHFGDPRQEYRHWTEDLAVVDRSQVTQVRVAGSDAPRFLQNLCTNDVASLPVGGGCEAFVLSPQGKIVGYVWVFREEDSLLLQSAPGQGHTLAGHLEFYHIRERVEIRDETDQHCQLALGGPQADQCLQDLGIQPPETQMAHRPAMLAGHRLHVRKVDQTIAGEFLLDCLMESVAAVWRMLHGAGAAACGWQAWDMARVEAGTPEFDRDIAPENLPQEVDRNDRAISFTKGCYVGQETVARIDALGHVNRLLRGLKFEGAEVPAPGHQLQRDGRPAARVTSAVWSPRFQAPLALGYVRRGSHEPGTVLGDQPPRATVLLLGRGEAA